MTKEEKEALLKAVSEIKVTGNNPDSPVFESKEITSEITSKIYEIPYKGPGCIHGRVFFDNINNGDIVINRAIIQLDGHDIGAKAEIHCYNEAFDEQKILEIATLIYQLLDEQTERKES